LAETTLQCQTRDYLFMADQWAQ